MRKRMSGNLLIVSASLINLNAEQTRVNNVHTLFLANLRHVLALV